MSDILDGVGTATQGGLFARALEPDSGAKKKHPDQPENCLNCGAELVGAYCHACGQPAHIHRTIGGIVHDLLHGALHFEGKLWRTLPMLVLRPGKLTRRYIEGARARFVSPMALFLFSVFLMFAVFQALGLTAPSDLDEVETQSEGTQIDLVDQVASQAAPELVVGDADVAQQALGEAFEDLRAEQEAAAAEEGTNPADDGAGTINATFTGIEAIDQGIIKKWNDNPSLMLYKLQANIYKFSWLLIPISIPFVWLLFVWKRKYRAYDHAIFVTYSLSFMTLLFVTVSLGRAADLPNWPLALAIMLVPPIHLYKQLRGTYALSRFSAFWRLMALSVFIWIILILFLQVLLLLGSL